MSTSTTCLPGGECCYAAMLPCRQIAHRIRKAAVVAGRNVIKLRDEVKTLSETRRVGSVLIRVRSAWPMVVNRSISPALRSAAYGDRHSFGPPGLYDDFCR